MSKKSKQRAIARGKTPPMVSRDGFTVGDVVGVVTVTKYSVYGMNKPDERTATQGTIERITPQLIFVSVGMSIKGYQASDLLQWTEVERLAAEREKAERELMEAALEMQRRTEKALAESAEDMLVNSDMTLGQIAAKIDTQSQEQMEVERGMQQRRQQRNSTAYRRHMGMMGVAMLAAVAGMEVHPVRRDR